MLCGEGRLCAHLALCRLLRETAQSVRACLKKAVFNFKEVCMDVVLAGLLKITCTVVLHFLLLVR
jgi:hypothetical protein